MQSLDLQKLVLDMCSIAAKKKAPVWSTSEFRGTITPTREQISVDLNDVLSCCCKGRTNVFVYPRNIKTHREYTARLTRKSPCYEMI